MLSIKKLNDKTVHAIPDLIGAGTDLRPIKGAELFPEIYANIFLVARKKSGKTSVVFKIIKDCCTKDTYVHLFVSTLYKDKSWSNIRKYLDMRKIRYDGFTSIVEDGADQLLGIVNQLANEAKACEEDCEDEQTGGLLKLHQYDDDEDTPKRKSKYLAPEHLFIFDDLSTELKNKSLISLLKKNRHFKSKVILSSQYLHDLDIQSRRQIDTYLVFRGQSIEKLQIIYKDSDVAISFDEFMKIYKYAVETPYSFLYIDCTSSTFRKNFSVSIKIKSQ